MTITYRWLDYEDPDEVRHVLEIFYSIPEALNPWWVAPTESFLEEVVLQAIAEETRDNTFAGVAFDGGDAMLVGFHVVRRFEEWGRIGAHIAALWVAPEWRGLGIGAELKRRGEAWAREIGASFLNTNVSVDNARMLEINRAQGFEPVKLNLRKRL